VTPELIGMMLMAVLGAVVLYTFIGFIPGTDETSVLAPITLAVVLSGAPPEVVLAFFVSAVVTLNLMNGIPTALVGLPGGVMSAPLMEHSVFLRNRGLASETIRKMAVGSAIGTVVSIPLSFILAGLLAPIADPIKAQTPVILAAGTVLLALLGTNRILALVAIIPLALMFQALPTLYRSVNIIGEKGNVNISFFLGITVGPMLITLLELLNAKRRAALPHGTRTRTSLLRSGFESQALMPGRMITRSEGRWSALMAAVSTPLFVLSPVGLTFLLGEASVARQKKDPVRRAQRAVTVMSSLTHSTYLAGVIIPLVALGIPVSGVSAGPAGPLFNAPPRLRSGQQPAPPVAATRFHSRSRRWRTDLGRDHLRDRGSLVVADHLLRHATHPARGGADAVRGLHPAAGLHRRGRPEHVRGAARRRGVRGTQPARSLLRCAVHDALRRPRHHHRPGRHRLSRLLLPEAG